MRGLMRSNKGMAPIAVARKPKTATLIITAAGWTGTSCVVSTGRLRVRAGSNVFVSVENKADADAYGAAGCFVSGIGTNALNFVCDTTPTVDITINVVLL